VLAGLARDQADASSFFDSIQRPRYAGHGSQLLAQLAAPVRTESVGQPQQQASARPQLAALEPLDRRPRASRPAGKRAGRQAGFRAQGVHECSERGQVGGVTTDRRARVELPPGDIDPDSGRARLSYRQAEDLFKAASGGATLHQLRHSALTHDAEDGASTPMLMAKSGHTSVASLARYARPSAEALARWQASRDPARRR
jgi:integrase